MYLSGRSQPKLTWPLLVWVDRSMLYLFFRWSNLTTFTLDYYRYLSCTFVYVGGASLEVGCFLGTARMQQGLLLFGFGCKISLLHNIFFLFLLHNLFLLIVAVSCTCPVEVSQSWLGRYLFELIGLCYSCLLGGQISQPSVLVSTDIWLVLLFM